MLRRGESSMLSQLSTWLTGTGWTGAALPSSAASATPRGMSHGRSLSLSTFRHSLDLLTQLILAPSRLVATCQHARHTDDVG